MNFTVRPTNFYLKQINEFDRKTKDILLSKMDLIKINPFRFKAIHSDFGKVFSIKFSEGHKAKRLVYLIRGNEVLICFLIDRYNFKKIADDLKLN